MTLPTPAIDMTKEYALDDPLPEGLGTLRDYVTTGLIMREKIETAGSHIRYEATFERPNTHPGTAKTQTICLSEAAYNELEILGVP